MLAGEADPDSEENQEATWQSSWGEDAVLLPGILILLLPPSWLV